MARRLRRRTSIEPTLVQWLVFAGIAVFLHYSCNNARGFVWWLEGAPCISTSLLEEHSLYSPLKSIMMYTPNQRKASADILMQVIS